MDGLQPPLPKATPRASTLPQRQRERPATVWQAVPPPARVPCACSSRHRAVRAPPLTTGRPLQPAPPTARIM
eukprot:scaffold2502_cov362-Prasinococcus_capsulatus_cf.AAC.17